MVKPLGKCQMLLKNPKTETSHHSHDDDVELIVFKDNDDCQPILGLQTSEQMHLVKIKNNNFHRVAAVQDDSCFNSLFDDKLQSWENFLVCNTSHSQSTQRCAPRLFLER